MKQRKPAPIVTRESLREMLDAADRKQRAKIIGRALVRLYQRQTAAEQNAKTTTDHNSIGFASCDAEVGSRIAQSFLQYGTLLDWMVDVWMQADSRTGFPRICKYHRQLNEVAVEVAAKRAVAE